MLISLYNEHPVISVIFLLYDNHRLRNTKTDKSNAKLTSSMLSSNDAKAHLRL